MERAQKIAIIGLTLLLYTVTNYGGIRGPDEEVMFRAGESLLDRGNLTIAPDLGPLAGFGVARGRDGQLYSIFGPLQSILCAPLIGLGRRIAATGWYEGREDIVPASFYVGDGLMEYLQQTTPSHPYEDAVRFVVSFYNVVVCAAIVGVFWSVCARLTPSRTGVLLSATLLALGTPLWPYAGKFNSDPTALLFVLIAADQLLRLDPRLRPAAGEARGAAWRGLVAGVSLGLGTAAHISACLFVPFFAGYCLYNCWRSRDGRRTVAAFASGCGVVLILLGYYNLARFGSVFETGRTVSPTDVQRFGYGYFVLPWRGLYGLLLSPGKGLLLYSPAVLLGLLCWRHLQAKAPALSLTLGGAVAFRLLFMASRSDWHGGFCLGPRYLLMMIPFMILPVALWVEAAVRERRWWRLVLCSLAVLLCISQQLYFSLGEVSSYYHAVKFAVLSHHQTALFGDGVYMIWSVAPLGHLLAWRRGPFLLQGLPLSNQALWLAGTLIVWAALVPLIVYSARCERGEGRKQPS